MGVPGPLTTPGWVPGPSPTIGGTSRASHVPRAPPAKAFPHRHLEGGPGQRTNPPSQVTHENEALERHLRPRESESILGCDPGATCCADPTPAAGNGGSCKPQHSSPRCFRTGGGTGAGAGRSSLCFGFGACRLGMMTARGYVDGRGRPGKCFSRLEACPVSSHKDEVVVLRTTDDAWLRGTMEVCLFRARYAGQTFPPRDITTQKARIRGSIPMAFITNARNPHSY